MLHDNRIRVLNDFEDAGECFSGVEIKGGVCYFLWDRDHRGDCKVITHSNGKIVSEMTRPLLEDGCDIFIRYNESIDILHKVKEKKELSISEIISTRKPFGLPTNFKGYMQEKDDHHPLKIYANKAIGYIDERIITKNTDWIEKWKLYVPEAIGSGDLRTDMVKPILGEPGTACTETYLVFGPFERKSEAENCISYIQTKFFHLLLGLKKITQHTTVKVYDLVPVQDFSKPWTDEELYDKYGLTDEEINFIESMIKPME